VSVAGLAAISRRLFKERLAREPWVAEAGLRPPSYGVMSCVARLEPASQKQISDLMGVDPSDMVSAIDILERAGFVIRERDVDDRRRYSLSLTTSGRSALRRLDKIAAEVNAHLLAPLSAEDRAAFVSLVEQLMSHHNGT
jgi:DNA-binding MarR family transcriptional regulator